MQCFLFFSFAHRLSYTPNGILKVQLFLCFVSVFWAFNIDRGNVNAVVFLDLKKAFDTVDHDIPVSYTHLTLPTIYSV